MRVVLRSSVLIMSALIIIIGLGLSVLREPLSHGQAGWFTDPFSQPCPTICLFGVQPGRTTMRDAILLVSKHPLTQHLNYGIVGNEARFHQRAEYAITVRIVPDSRNRMRVGQMVIRLPDSTLSFADLLTVLGPPQTTQLALRDRRYGYVSWYYNESRMISTGWIGSGEIAPDEHVMFIELNAANPAVTIPVLINTDPLQTFTSDTWLGFGSVDKYIGPVSQALQPTLP